MPTTTARPSPFARPAVLSVGGLLTLWEQQRRTRPSDAHGVFGPPGWLAEANVAPLLLTGDVRWPELEGDVLAVSDLPSRACALLQSRLPESVLDHPTVCGPSTRAILRAGAQHREVRPSGYAVGPDREDERLMLDGFTLTLTPTGPLSSTVVADLLRQPLPHGWRAEGQFVEEIEERVWEDERELHNLADEYGDAEDRGEVELADWIEERIEQLEHRLALAQECLLASELTHRLRPLWPRVAERLELVARHDPDEITLETGDPDADRVGLRFWWRWGGGPGGCPTQDGTRYDLISIDELVRTLA